MISSRIKTQLVQFFLSSLFFVNFFYLSVRLYVCVFKSRLIVAIRNYDKDGNYLVQRIFLTSLCLYSSYLFI